MGETNIRIKDIGTEVFLKGTIKSANWVNTHYKDSAGNNKHRKEVVYEVDVESRISIDEACSPITEIIRSNGDELYTEKEIEDLVEARKFNMAINGPC